MFFYQDFTVKIRNVLHFGYGPVSPNIHVVPPHVIDNICYSGHKPGIGKSISYRDGVRKVGK